MVILIVILILIIGIIVFGFLRGFTTFHIYRKAQNGQCRVACIGDSITYGCGVKNWIKNNYPSVLNQMLGSKYCVNNYGYSGRTLMSSGEHPYIEKSVFKKSLAFKPEIVIIKFGTNDAKVENWKGKEKFEEEYQDFLFNYQKLESNPKIYLCTPAAAFYPEGSTDGKICGNVIIPRENLEEAVETVLKLGKELNIPVIDIHRLTTGHAEWFIEGIHPNVYGAKMLAEEIYKKIYLGN